MSGRNNHPHFTSKNVNLPKVIQMKRLESSFPRTGDWALFTPRPLRPSSHLWLWHALILPSPEGFHFYFLPLPPPWKWALEVCCPLCAKEHFPIHPALASLLFKEAPSSPVSGFREQTSLLLIYDFHYFVDFHPISLPRVLNFEVCSHKQPLALHSGNYSLTLL